MDHKEGSERICLVYFQRFRELGGSTSSTDCANVCMHMCVCVCVFYRERYRDLIDAADSIVDMQKCSEQVKGYIFSATPH